MPEPRTAARPNVVALAMVVSAIVMFVVAVLTFVGIVPLPEESRPLVGGLIVAASFVDLLVGVWFFSKGQSS